MFAGKAIRPARQLTGQVRRYATEPQGRSNNMLWAGAGLAILGAGTYAMYGGGGDKIAAKTSTPATTVAGTGPKTFTGGDQGFVSLVLKDVEEINHNTKKFSFKLPTEDSVSGLPVTSAILTKYKGPEMEKPVLRPYTPVSDEDSPGHMDFIIKRYPNGPMSEHFHNMEPGQQMEFKGPLPKYPWTPNKHDHIALVAGGTGITPMYQLARAIFKNPEDKTKVTLVFANVSENDVLLKREWEKLEQDFPQRFRAFYLLEQPPEGWKMGKGRVDKDVLKTVLPDPKQGNVKIFVCGPPGMYKAISGMKKSPADQGELSGYLKELGYTQEQVFKF